MDNNIESKGFYGHYFKHYNNGKTVAFIPGTAQEGGSIQVITEKKSYYFTFPTADMGEKIKVGNCEFDDYGIKIDLPDMSGEIFYSNLTPIKYDFMGILKYFPLQCRHSVISMRHDLQGSLEIEGKTYDFNGGVGYHECDSGTSFPEKYLWVQCNNFKEDCSILMSIAQVPVLGVNMRGSICIIILNGKEYRLSTYLGAMTKLTENSIEMRQLNLRVVADIIDKGDELPLASASGGIMSGKIEETNNAKMRFRFYINGKIQFDITSDYVGFERQNL